MKTVTAVVIGMFAGFAAGAAVGYLVADKKLEKEYEQALEVFLESREEVRKSKQEAYPWGSETPSEEGFVDHLTRKYGKSIEEAENPYLEYAAEREHPREEEGKEPYVISSEDFTDGNLEYEKLSYTYCRGDDTLLDENEEIVQVSDTIGDDVLRYIMEVLPGGPITVYVRNDRLGADYEVVFIDSSYSRDFLGMDEGGSDD